jgi:hypothetical protein
VALWGRIAGQANLNAALVINPGAFRPRVDRHSERLLKATAIRKVMRPDSHRRTSPIPILSVERWGLGSFFGALYGRMVGEKFFKYPGSMWVGGPPPFFPTPEAGESNMEIVFPEDNHGFALRQPI